MLLGTFAQHMHMKKNTYMELLATVDTRSNGVLSSPGHGYLF